MLNQLIETLVRILYGSREAEEGNRINKDRERIVNRTFVQMLDELGYDVELIYKQIQKMETER